MMVVTGIPGGRVGGQMPWGATPVGAMPYPCHPLTFWIPSEDQGTLVQHPLSLQKPSEAPGGPLNITSGFLKKIRSDV